MSTGRCRPLLLLPLLLCFSLWPSCGQGFDFTSWFNQANQQCSDECPATHFTSTYNLPCHDRCDTRGYSYYWCQTRSGWDYCSPGENTDYYGNTCQTPCDHNGGDEHKCYLLNGGLSPCGRVQPKALIHSTRYLKRCIEECVYQEDDDYFWCYTEDGWEYCSPGPDVTYQNVKCRDDHPCGTHDKSYSWCYTSYFNWDYCGIVSPGECSYTESQHRRKRQMDNRRLICTRKDDDNNNNNNNNNNRRVTNFIDMGGQDHITTVSKKLHNEALDLINRWDNQGLTDQARSNLIRSDNFRIDNQGMCNVNNQRCYNLQVQRNIPRNNRESTTVAQIIVPIGTSSEYMRLAFTESLMNQIRVQLEESVEPGPSTSNTNNRQKCCRRRKH